MSTQGPLSPGTVVDDPSVGTVAWSNPNNAKVSDNVYALADFTGGGGGATTSYLKLTNFGFTIPAGSTINGILVETQKWANNNTAIATFDSSIKIVKSDGTYGPTDKADLHTKWPLSEGYVSNGSASDLWGVVWSVDDINNANFGVGISAFLQTTGNNSEAGIDHVRITVSYTPPATTTSTSSSTSTTTSTSSSTSSTSTSVSSTSTSSSTTTAITADVFRATAVISPSPVRVRTIQDRIGVR